MGEEAIMVPARSVFFFIMELLEALSVSNVAAPNTSHALLALGDVRDVYQSLCSPSCVVRGIPDLALRRPLLGTALEGWIQM